MLDIRNTVEVFEFVEGAIKDLTLARQDDGVIDLAEWLQTSVKNLPNAVSAFLDADLIDDELKNLDKKEIEIIASRGLIVAQLLVALLIPAKGKKG